MELSLPTSPFDVNKTGAITSNIHEQYSSIAESV